MESMNIINSPTSLSCQYIYMVWSSIKACVVVQIKPMNIVKWLIFMLLCKHVIYMVWSSIKACVVVQIKPMNIVKWLIFMLLCKHVVSWASWHLCSSGCKGAQHMLKGSAYSQIVLVGLSESALNLLWNGTCCSLPSGMYDSECVIVLVPCVSVKGLCLSITGQLCRDERGRACLLQIPHTSMTQLHVSMCGWG